jgi:hypothetical protein
MSAKSEDCEAGTLLRRISEANKKAGNSIADTVLEQYRSQQDEARAETK